MPPKSSPEATGAHTGMTGRTDPAAVPPAADGPLVGGGPVNLAELLRSIPGADPTGTDAPPAGPLTPEQAQLNMEREMDRVMLTTAFDFLFQFWAKSSGDPKKALSDLEAVKLGQTGEAVLYKRWPGLLNNFGAEIAFMMALGMAVGTRMGGSDNAGAVEPLPHTGPPEAGPTSDEDRLPLSDESADAGSLKQGHTAL